MREYTHHSVLEGIAAGADWADPVMNPEEIDWAARQAAAAIPFQVVDGRPVNPCADTGIRRGRNELGHWGEKQAADAVIFATTTIIRWGLFQRTARSVVLIERDDDHGWAVPGGMVEPGETAIEASIREALEETGVDLTGEVEVALDTQYVPDPRGSNEAWMVTTPVVFHLERMVPLQGGDDARRAEWVCADSYRALERDLDRRFGGTVFAAHREMLVEMLG